MKSILELLNEGVINEAFKKDIVEKKKQAFHLGYVAKESGKDRNIHADSEFAKLLVGVKEGRGGTSPLFRAWFDGFDSAALKAGRELLNKRKQEIADKALKEAEADISKGEIRTSTTNGITYKTTQFNEKGQIYVVTEASGKSNYVNIKKTSNNPFLTTGKEFKNWDDAIKSYKSPGIHAALIIIEKRFKEAK